LTGGEGLTYAEATRKFTVSTDDTSLQGTIVPYSVVATLVNYPIGTFTTAPQIVGGANILFGNPCIDAQIYPSIQSEINKSDAYTGTPVTFQITPFVTDPALCRVIYTCNVVLSATSSL
jgi:hypothetical protein